MTMSLAESTLPKHDTFSPENPAGITRCLWYDEIASLRVVQEHTDLAERYGVCCPYFEFTDKGEPYIQEIDLGEDITLRVGPIGAFSREQVARYIQEQTSNYIGLGTMGRDFPQDDAATVKDLMAIMIGDFDPDQIIVLLEKESVEGVNPVAGVKGYYGRSENPLLSTMVNSHLGSNGHKPEYFPATLSTFQALKASDPSAIRREFAEKYSQLPESQFICMSRLFRQDPATTAALGLQNRDVAWIAMAALPIGLVTHAVNHPGRLPSPKIALYDTHTDYIQSKLDEYFGIKKIVSAGNVMPTDEVMETILRFHYGPHDIGGYQEDIFVGATPITTYFLRALHFLQERGISIDVPHEVLDYLKTEIQNDKELPELAGIINGVVDLRRLSPFIHLVESWESPEIPPHPEVLRPEILDPNDRQSLERIFSIANSLSDSKTQIQIEPYIRGVNEMLELVAHCQSLPKSREQLIDAVTARLILRTDIPEEDIRTLLEENPIAEDLVHLREQVSVHGGLERINEESRWIWNPASQRLTKYIGGEAHRILSMSRLLGLIPFETIRQLRQIQINTAGASAVATTLDLLAALGAEHISMWDGGTIDPSNIPRYPAPMGSYESVGGSKSQELQAVLYSRNPYGNFLGYPGRVIPDEAQRVSSNDVTFEDFAQGSLLLEVVDNPWIKTQLREYLQTHNPDAIIGFLADVANQGMFGLEIPVAGNHFNQPLLPEELARMASVPRSITSNPDPIQRSEQMRSEALRSVVQMLDGYMPEEHLLQFIYGELGFIPYWSQTPIAAHDSASVAAKVILQHLQGRPVQGTNFQPHTVESTLVPPSRKSHTLSRIISTLFYS